MSRSTWFDDFKAMLPLVLIAVAVAGMALGIGAMLVMTFIEEPVAVLIAVAFFAIWFGAAAVATTIVRRR